MAEFAHRTQQGSRQPSNLRLLMASLFVCVALLAGLGAWALHHQSRPSPGPGPGPGPLGPQGQADRFSSTGIPVGSGDLGTFAQIFLDNPTGDEAVIDEVRLVPSPTRERVQLLHGWVVTPASGDAVRAAFGGPPEQHYPGRLPAAGTTIPPRSNGYLLGLTLAGRTDTARPQSWVNGVDVRYHVGGRHYLDRWPDQVVLCPGTTCAPWTTAGPDGSTDWPPKPAYLGE